MLNLYFHLDPLDPLDDLLQKLDKFVTKDPSTCDIIAERYDMIMIEELEGQFSTLVKKRKRSLSFHSDIEARKSEPKPLARPQTNVPQQIIDSQSNISYDQDKLAEIIDVILKSLPK